MNPPTFTLLRFNPRRAARKAPAAEVKILWEEDGAMDIDVLWMSLRDINQNIREHANAGDVKLAGLFSAIAAYHRNVPFPAETP